MEVTVNPGLAKFEIIGLADAAIRESRERIFHSIKKHGYEVPPGNITVNLAPAEIKKTGTSYDLPIALGILISSGQVNCAVDLSQCMIAGELTLDGDIRRVKGVFNTAITFKDEDYCYLIPQRNVIEIHALLYNKVVGGQMLSRSDTVYRTQQDSCAESEWFSRATQNPFHGRRTRRKD